MRKMNCFIAFCPLVAVFLFSIWPFFVSLLSCLSNHICDSINSQLWFDRVTYMERSTHIYDSTASFLCIFLTVLAWSWRVRSVFAPGSSSLWGSFFSFFFLFPFFLRFLSQKNMFVNLFWISVLCDGLKKRWKKVWIMFGGDTKSLYLCIRFRERNIRSRGHKEAIFERVT